MGDFSQDSKIRLAHSLKKHYVGVRMQQGKPILDCDWNELEDLRKHELNDLFRQFVGSGVPTGNNGFGIEALYNGGEGIIVLTAEPDGEGYASLEIDIDASTAAGVLGFLPGKAYTERYDAVSVKLTGNAVGPFTLTAGMTLTVKINGHEGQTVTFPGNAFGDIAKASAQEVVEVINHSLTGASAQAGAGNDFIITGGTGENPGRILVEGLQALNEAGMVYTSQRLYDNNALAEEWGVAEVPPLQTPSGIDREDIVYIDVWEREVDQGEDEAMVLPALGIETTVRLKREWAVRVASMPGELSTLKNPPPGHFFCSLARLHRKAGNQKITSEMIEDLRDTQLAVKRKIEVRNDDDNVVIDTQRFKQMLENTRDNAVAFIRYITTTFNVPTTILNAGEIIGLQTTEHIAKTAEIGIGIINSESLGNRGSLKFLYQMYNAENNFMTVWRDVVLLLGAEPRRYATYDNFIQRLNRFLHQLESEGQRGLKPALDAGDLEDAVKIQEEIARLIGKAGANIPRGSIHMYLARVTPFEALASGKHARFEFRVKSLTTMLDTYTVSILPAEGWQRTLVDQAGGPVSNNRVSIGASGSETTLYVDVVGGTGTCNLQLSVTSDSNPTEINQFTGLYILTEGELPPTGEDKVQLERGNITGATTDPNTGVIKVPIGGRCVIDIRVHSFTGLGVKSIFEMSRSHENEKAAGTWDTSFSLTPLTIPDNGSASTSVIVKPKAGAVSMNLIVSAKTTTGGDTFSGQLTIPLEALPV